MGVRVGQIAVDFRTLEEGEASLREAVDQIDAELHELEIYVAKLLDTWTGEAAEAYRAAQHDWDAAVEGMRQNVRDLHQLIVTAHLNHTEAVHGNTAIWRV